MKVDVPNGAAVVVTITSAVVVVTTVIHKHTHMYTELIKRKHLCDGRERECGSLIAGAAVGL